jgi:hypothetical protein
LFQTQDLCTHTMPNRVQIIPADFKFNFASQNVVKVAINDNYKAEAVLCQSGASTCDKSSGTVVHGTWSTIYS